MGFILFFSISEVMVSWDAFLLRNLCCEIYFILCFLAVAVLNLRCVSPECCADCLAVPSVTYLVAC